MEARAIAFKVLLEIEKGAYANLILDETLRKAKNIPPPDRGLITEIVYGTVKYRVRLDWLIEQMVKRADKLAKGPRVLLRLSFYQLLFMDRIPPFAVTNEAVKLARKFFHRGVASLVNGVLRSYLREPERVTLPDAEKAPLEYLEVVYSHPRWMLERWLQRYGWENTVKLCEYNNAPSELWVRVNTLKCSPDELVEKLTLEGCLVERSTRVPEGLRLISAPPLASLSSFQSGLFTIQDESSMLVAHVVNPQAHMEVLDVCAGPGGKTTHLAQLMENKGKILACDIHKHRIRLIEENANRLGISIIKTRLQDATQLGLNQDHKYDHNYACNHVCNDEFDLNARERELEKELKKLKFAKGLNQRYNLVLIDAPCSGLGVLRRRPDARWRKKPEEILALAALQYRILESVYHVLAPEARIVYSTCTLEPEENFGVIDKFINTHSDMVCYDLTTSFPYVPRTREEAEELKRGKRQFLPFRDGMEGFFIAGIQKK